MHESCITNRSVNTSTQLDELVAQLSARVEAGEPIDLAALTADCPHYREQLEMLLPTLQAVVDLEHSIGNKTESFATPNHPGREEIGGGAACESIAGQLGDFRILRELGRGGMGIVYEAEQISLGRRVALKVLPFAAMLDKQQLTRFKNEARAAATLDHPNIVAIYSVGVDRGVHYYAMQLVEGQSLAQMIDGLRAKRKEREAGREVSGIGCQVSGVGTEDTAPAAKLSTLPDYSSREYFRAIATLGIQAAEALDHAHQSGILHRDIKPANLLVDDDGKLWITDFGLARLETDAGMTMTGDLIGTLRYMSPEQALAKRVVVDHRSDVYSLGATLYELLTLSPAYTADDRQELLRQIAFEDPKKLRHINSRIPQDLETIVLKAIEKNPADRYLSAQHLADDLQRFVDDRPIKAKPPALVNRTIKWSRRHRGILVAATALLIVLTAGSLISTALLWHEQQRTLLAAAESKAVVSFLVNDLLAAPIEETKLEREITVSEVLVNAESKIAKGLADQPLVEAAVRHSMAKSFQTLRKFDKAESHARHALDLRTRLLGPTHHDTLDSTTVLAQVLVALNKHDEARQLCRDALDVTRRSLGTEHADTISSMNRMVWLLLQSPSFDEGSAESTKALCDEALDAAYRSLGAEHRETLRATSFKAALLYRSDDREAAEELCRATLATSRKTLGAADPLTLELSKDMASFLEDHQQYLDAIKIYEDVLDRERRELGSKDPETLRTIRSLAGVSIQVRRFDASRKLVEEGLAASRQLYGPDYPATIQWKQLLVWALRGQGNYAESHRLQKEIVDWKRQHLGTENHQTLEAMGQLAYDLRQLDRHNESQHLYSELLAIGRKLLKRDDPVLLSAMLFRADELRKQGKVVEAWKMLEELLEVVRSLPPVWKGDMYTVIGSRVKLIRWLTEDGDIPQAKNALAETIDQLPPANWYFRNVIAWFLATSNSDQIRDGHQALKLATEACELTEYKAATALDTLAAAYAELGDFQAAVVWDQKAIDLAQSLRERERFERHLDKFKSGTPWRDEDAKQPSNVKKP